MRRNKVSRFFAMMLCASMLFTCEPVSTFADTARASPTANEKTTETPAMDAEDAKTDIKVSETGVQSTEQQSTEAPSTEPQSTEVRSTETPSTEINNTETLPEEAESSTEVLLELKPESEQETEASNAEEKTLKEEKVLEEIKVRQKQAGGTEVFEVSNLLELAEAVNQTEETQAATYTFTAGETDAVINGESVEMSAECTEKKNTLKVPADVFAEDEAIDADSFAGKDGMVDVSAIAEHSDYEVVFLDNTASLLDTFTSKRLIVISSTGFDTCGAVSVIQGYGDIYILNFDTEDAVKTAYDTLSQVPDLTVELEESIAISTEEGSKTEDGVAEIASDMPSVRTTSKDIIVAVVDSGYDMESDTTKVVEGADMTGSGSIKDENGHGTKMSKIITENSSDCVKTMPVKVTGGDGRTSSLKLYLGIKYAMEKQADIINISLTAYKASDSQLVANAINEAVVSGIPVVVAAGNSSDDTKHYTPANLDSAFVVSAINSDQSFMELSNHGETVDFATYGSVKVGEEIVTGTSVSAAVFSYALAQMMVMDNAKTPEEIYELLKTYAEDAGEEGKDAYFGNGIVTPTLINGIYDGLGCDTAELLTCDFKALSDEALNELMMETKDIDLSRFMKNLSEEEVRELLKRDTMMGKPIRLWDNVTEDENTSTFVEYKTYYEYLLQAEFEVCESKSGYYTVGIPGDSGKVSFKVKDYNFGAASATQSLSDVKSPSFVTRLNISKGDGQFYCYIGSHVVFKTEKHTSVKASDKDNGGSSGVTSGAFPICTESRDYAVQVSYYDCGLAGNRNYSISFSKSAYGTNTSTSGTASCTTQKVTTVKCKNDSCKDTISRTTEGPYGHGDNGGVLTVAPTCTSGGNKVHSCPRCGIFRYNEPLPALGHEYSPAWTYEGNNGIENGLRYHWCIRGDATAGHEYRQLTYVSLQQPDGSYPGWMAVTDGYYGASSYVPAWSIGNAEYAYTVRDAYISGGYAQANHVYVPRNRYTLSYDVNSADGKVSTPQTVTYYGAPWGTLATASRTGYKFLGWFTQKTGGAQVTAGSINYGNATVYAHWEALPYTLTFDANGGTATPRSKTVYFDSPYGSLARAVREGFQFTGWYDSKKDTAKEIFATKICKGEATLYAHWITLYTINLNPAGIDSITGKTVAPDDISKITKTVYKCKEKDGTYVDDQCKQSTKVVNVPSMDNFVFDGYFLGDTQMVDKDGNILADTAGTGDQTWEARWTRNTFIVTLDNSGAINPGTKNIYEKCNTKEFFNNTNMDNQIDSITKPDFGSNLFIGYFDKDGNKMVDENGKIICDRVLTDDEVWSAKWDTQINISYLGNEKQDADKYDINARETKDDFTDPDVELESRYEFSDNKEGDAPHFARTVTKEVDEKYEESGTLEVESRIVAWNVGEEVQEGSKINASKDGSISSMKAEELLQRAQKAGAITSGAPTNDFKSAEAKLEAMTRVRGLNLKNVFGIFGEALGFQAKAVANESELRRYINMYAVWDNGPTLEAKDLYISLEMAQDPSENGVTEEWLLSMANAYDDELKGITDEKGSVKHGVDTANGTTFSVIDYNRIEFTNFAADGAVSIWYQVTDKAGNVTKKRVMVEIVDTSIGYRVPGWDESIRFVSKKYYNLTNDGMEGAVDTFPETSKWVSDPEYAAILTKALNNKRVDERTVSFMGGLYTATVAGSGHWETPPKQTWYFTHEQVLELKAYVDEHGPGNMLEPDALANCVEQFKDCKKTGAEAEYYANPGNWYTEEN